MKLAWAFLKRDAAIAFSYRAAFFAQFLGNFIMPAILYFMSKTVAPRSLPALERYGGNYLAFLLIGVALTDCVTISLATFAAQVRESQTTGTLEATLMSPVRLSAILIYSSLWNYLIGGVRFALYLIVGAVAFDVGLGRANLPAAALLFVLTVLCFMGFGILWAGIVLIIKRGEAITGMLGVGVLMLGGVLFPVTVFPSWVRAIANLIPLTPALEGMRLALLQGSGVSQLSSLLVKLSVFAFSLLVAGILGFNMAVRVGRRTGSLSQY
jgi:ABC-2 type transport system permease protein